MARELASNSIRALSRLCPTRGETWGGVRSHWSIGSGQAQNAGNYMAGYDDIRAVEMVLYL